MGPDVRIVRDAWALMGGLDWAAFPIACEVLGVLDPEFVLAGLYAVREHFDEKDRRERERILNQKRGG